MSNATVRAEVSDSGYGVRTMFEFWPRHLLAG